ncbi:hypothetical protein GCM10008983_02150 [Lentibacillus halophilus]|uniref:Transcriptional regulator n=1 Tax=Lentibacillus halophilus TaxID=295065 RepID=A0ABN0Z201_9BACI
MKVRAGIVGADNSVKRVSHLSESEDGLIIIPLPYQHSQETVDIIRRYEHTVDIWVFTGIVPYLHAVNHGTSRLSFYLKLDYSSLKQTMLEMSYHHKMPLENVSFDTITKDSVTSVYEELNLPTNQIFIKELSHDVRGINDIIRFHENLYNNDDVNSCVTSIKSVYDSLTEKKIPVFRITPSKQTIKETLTSASLHFQTQQFKKSQIAIMYISLADDREYWSSQIDVDSYDAYRLNLRIKKEILNYSESVSGIYYAVNMNQFIIFSTRESFQNPGKMGRPLLQTITDITHAMVFIGIGYGDTASHANHKAALALQYAEDHQASCIFLGDETNTVEGPLEKNQSISFSFHTDDPKVMEKLKKSGVSVSSYNKIISVQKQSKEQSVTASQLATWLNMTQRNARRILNGLLNEGLAEIAGEEVPTSKGRPRKIYRIL